MRILLLSAVLASVSAQRNIKDPVKDFCRRHLHQTCVIDSKLYIDGGMVYYSDDVDSWDNETMLTQNTALLWENVNDTSSEDFPVQHTDLPKDPNVPSVSGGVLWPDTVNKYFYLFGGEYETTDAAKGKDSQGVDLWRFDTIYNNWTKTKPHSTQNKIKWPVNGAGAVHENGWGYYYGGYLTNRSTSGWTGDRLMLNSMLRYDMNSTEWTNTTIDKTARAEGILQYIPASAGGMLVYFGGLETNPSNNAVSYSNMSQIRVYDFGDNRWYTQTAGGNIPQPRRGFCGGTVWAKDKSSYNIYIFGGISAQGAGLGDIHVLSLPSFQWFLVTPNPNLPIFPRGKAFSSCNIIHDSQFMVIGGLYVNKTIDECDVKIIGGQHAALLGQESFEQAVNGNPAWWHRPMNNVTQYRVPDLLTKVIGGNNEGSATAKSPPDGWGTNTELSVYFGATMTAKARTATREIPSATDSSSGSGNKPNVGVIAGGTVGGVVVLAGIIVLVYFCLKSRRRVRDGQVQSADSVEPAQSSHGPEMARKSVASVSVSQGSTLHSPYLQSPSWSPQGSPPPPNAQPWHGAMPAHDPYYRGSPSSQQQHMSGEWAQPGQHVYQQTYYPPPPDPSQSPKGQHMHAQSVEMPSVRSPANIAEMPQMKSPVPLRSPQ